MALKKDLFCRADQADQGFKGTVVIRALLFCMENILNYIQGVPHHIRSCITQNCDLRDKSENLKTMNHLKNVKGFFKSFLVENTRVFEYYVLSLALKLGTLCITYTLHISE